MGPISIGPNVAAEKCCRWPNVANGMVSNVAPEKCCRWPQMGSMLLLRNAADGLKWAQCCSSDMLPMVSNGPQMLLLRNAADGLKWASMCAPADGLKWAQCCS
jgi:hypothetical protein